MERGLIHVGSFGQVGIGKIVLQHRRELRNKVGVIPHRDHLLEVQAERTIVEVRAANDRQF